MRRALVLAALVGCSFPTKHPDVTDGASDATPFGCAGQPFQTTAPLRIRIAGQALDFGTGVAGANLEVSGFLESGASVFTTTTDAKGDFSTVVDTGGDALAAHVATMQGLYVPSYFYPAHPFDADVADLPLPMLTSEELTQIGNPADTALVQLVLGDCLGARLEGCTLAIQPAPKLIEYTKNGVLSPSATTTDATGYVLVYGQPSGAARFEATCPTGPLRTAELAILSSSTYFLLLEP
jgi:hypothetical protein